MILAERVVCEQIWDKKFVAILSFGDSFFGDQLAY